MVEAFRGTRGHTGGQGARGADGLEAWVKRGFHAGGGAAARLDVEFVQPTGQQQKGIESGLWLVLELTLRRRRRQREATEKEALD